MPGDIVDDALAGAQLQTAERDEAAAAEDETNSDARPGSVEKKHQHHMGEGLEDFPSEEELHTLRRVADHIPLKLFTIAFIELCERFSYYGAIIVVCIYIITYMAVFGRT